MARIAVVTPHRPQETSGNTITATRWAQLLESAGHECSVLSIDEDTPDIPADVQSALQTSDVMIAIHARRSAAAVAWWRAEAGHRGLIVALAGTDLYVDLPDDPAARESLDLADAVVALQGESIPRLESMNPRWATKASVVHQSLKGPHPPLEPAVGEFRVVVLAHLRGVKDPLLAARAARLLPEASRVTVHHAGGELDADLVAAAHLEEVENPRYHWHRELDAVAARHLLASAHALACTSLSEGGANVVTEAIALGVPVIGTRIDGNTGLLGRDHPGLIPVGDEMALADLLTRLEGDPDLLGELRRRSVERQELVEPAREQAALVRLIDGLS